MVRLGRTAAGLVHVKAGSRPTTDTARPDFHPHLHVTRRLVRGYFGRFGGLPLKNNIVDKAQRIGNGENPGQRRYQGYYPTISHKRVLLPAFSVKNISLLRKPLISGTPASRAATHRQVRGVRA